MAALPRELVESTLFGHEKGAFTGAERRRIGAAEEAASGTLFLDEIGEMPLELQSKLLRFLQERAFRRVGGEADVRADVRIVSATNRDPLLAVREGTLREDLYYRLNVVPIQLPTLAQRPGDIPLLASAALKHYNQAHRKRFERIEPAAVQRLLELPWPGNVRQLMHAIERIVVLNEGEAITEAMLPEDLLNMEPEPAAADSCGASEPSPGDPPGPPRSHSAGSGTSNGEFQSAPDRLLDVSRARPDSVEGVDTAEAEPTHPFAARTQEQIVPLEDLERMAIEQAIRLCHGTAAQAARRLGISEATIYRKLKGYQLTTADILRGHRGTNAETD
jgi:DNA-binding NtrC family response regulator